MRPIAVIDCETDPFKYGRVPRPFLWGYYNGDTYEEFTSASDLVRFISERDEIIYAHNGGKFDYHFLLEYIEPFQEIMVINGRLAKFKIGDAECRDSFNILPIPLAQYQKTKIDYSIFEAWEREKPKNRRLISNYLYDDCVFLHDLVTKFIDRFGLHLTLAGCSMKQWQELRGEKPPSSSAGYYKELSPYYYGGRCQSFKHGYFKKDFKVADINSAYPYAMMFKHPISTKSKLFLGDKKVPLEDMGKAFYRVRCISRGAFPWRDKDGSLYFPNDKKVREYTITGWELKAAIETNTVRKLKIISTRLFDEYEDFSEYITKYYEERKIAKVNNDKANNIFCKLMMNALYGKFAANPEKYGEHKLYPVTHISAMKGEGYEFYSMLGGMAVGKKELEYKNYFNIATAASITGFVRAFLWRNICKCDGLLYCDTDSIAAENVDCLDFGPELGQWEIEGDFKTAALAGKKMYAFEPKEGGDWKTASKGVRVSPEEIVRASLGETITYRPEAPTFSVFRPVVDDDEMASFSTRRVKMTKKVAPKG